MAAHAIKHAVAKSGVEPEAVEDVYLGNGAHGAGNLARLAGLLAGLPVTTGGATIQRHCSSGLNAIALAANYIKDRRRRRRRGRRRRVDHHARSGHGRLGQHRPQARSRCTRRSSWPMIETADIVAERYDVSREYQDEYSLESQQRMAAAQAARALRRRDRPDEHHDEDGRQGDEGRVVRRLRRRPRRVQPSRHDARGSRQAAAGPRRGQLHHRRQRQPALRRRRRGRAHVDEEAEQARPHAAGRVQGLGRRRLRARRDGHRPGVRGAEAARSATASRSTTSTCGS